MLAATGDRFETAEVLATLFLVPALVGRPHLGTALALTLWIVLAAGALRVAAGVRHTT